MNEAFYKMKYLLLNIQNEILHRGMWQLPAGICVVIEWSLQSRCLFFAPMPPVILFCNCYNYLLLYFVQNHNLLAYWLYTTSFTPSQRSTH